MDSAGPSGAQAGQASPTSHEILSRLLELTPIPSDHLEVDQLLVTFDAILTRRAAVIATIVAPLRLDETACALRAELERRDQAWQGVLAHALRAVGEQRCGVSRLRAYGRR